MTSADISLTPDSTALRKVLREMDITVPLRTDGRKTAHTERWIICRLLSTLDQYGRIAFPISVTHRDKPDLLLAQDTLQVGIEATEAISEQYEKNSKIQL